MLLSVYSECAIPLIFIMGSLQGVYYDSNWEQNKYQSGGSNSCANMFTAQSAPSWALFSLSTPDQCLALLLRPDTRDTSGLLSPVNCAVHSDTI